MSDLTEKMRALRQGLVALDPYPWPVVETWIASAQPLVRANFAEHFQDFQRVCRTPAWTTVPLFSSGGDPWTGTPGRNNFAEAAAIEQRSNRQKCEEAKAKMLAFIDTLIGLLDSQQSGKHDPASTVLNLLDRFPVVCRALARRRRGRAPLEIADEYDVQYVVHALLLAVFDDVRPEEWTPSYAGNASRMDFLLKAERIVVETKIAGPAHQARQIADELIIDKERYGAHQDCNLLVCFVYDPGHALQNPVSLERDLSERNVSVVVRPK